MPELQAIQYGALGILAVVMYFLVKLMARFVDRSLDHMKEAVDVMRNESDKHDAHTDAIKEEVRDMGSAINARIGESERAIIEAMSGPRPRMGSYRG